MKESNIKGVWLKFLAVLIAVALVIPLAFSGLTQTRAYADEGGGADGNSEGVINHSDLPRSNTGGLTRIWFDTSDGYTKDEPRKTGNPNFSGVKGYGGRFIEIPESGEVQLRMPTMEDSDIGQPINYKDQNGEPNYELKGWILIPNIEDYKDENGDFQKLENYQYVKPGEVATLSKDSINSKGEILFYADWGPRSYDYGSADDTALGGIKEDIVATDAIKTKLYDINAHIAHVLFARYKQNGNWQVNETGPIFLETNPNIGEESKIIWPDGKGDYIIEYTDANGETHKTWAGSWTGWEGAAAEGLFDTVGMAQLFDANTLGVTYVGDANNGPMYYIGADDHTFNTPSGVKSLKGYYVYDSTKTAAVYNQSEERFYVYNEPQHMNTKDDGSGTGFLPFNSANDSEYRYQSGAINYHFGMKTDIDFFLTGSVPNIGQSSTNNMIEVDGEMKPMEFYFSGDDDVYVFVDDELVLDIGGIHNATEGLINFNTGEVTTRRTTDGTTWGKSEKVTYNLNDIVPGLHRGNHRLTIYYLERGASESNNLTAFLLTLPTTLQIQKLETQTGEPAVFPGTRFYLQDTDGNYYKLDWHGQDPNDPASVGQVSYVPAANKDEATLLTADENGIVTMQYIVDGDYVLTEEFAPAYYERKHLSLNL